MLDAVGRALSRPFPRLGSWTPFANSLATLLEGTVAVAVGLVLARGAAATRAWAAVAAAVLADGLCGERVAGQLAGRGRVARGVRRAGPAASLTPARCGGGRRRGPAVLASAVGGGTPWWMRVAGLAGRPDRLDVYCRR